MQKLPSNYQQLYQDKLKEHKICTNRYFNTLEGNTAKKLRQNYGDIVQPMHGTKFAIHMTECVKLFNSIMSIIGSSKSVIDDKSIEEAEKLLDKFHKQWLYSSKVLYIDQSLGAKYHYLCHCIQYVKLWRLPIGYISEQSIEAFHKTCSNVFNRYRTQRGVLRVKYSMQQLMFITSPLYQM